MISRKRRKWRTRGRNTRGGRRYRFTFITGAFTLQKIGGSVSCYFPSLPPSCFLPAENLPPPSVWDIRFYLFIKNFSLFPLSNLLRDWIALFPVSFQVYEVPRYILFSKLGYTVSLAVPVFSQGLKLCPSRSLRSSTTNRASNVGERRYVGIRRNALERSEDIENQYSMREASKAIYT